jgi:type I restriction enzyme, S subunit
MLTEYLLSFETNKLTNSAIGSNQKALTIVALNKIKLLLPLLPEQTRIVKILETWDKTIEKLTKKIELKRNIKKGLMQKLLTRKKRLKGFSEKWETVQLGDLIKTSSGGTPKSTKVEYYNGNIPWLKSGEVRKGKINVFENYITEEGLKNSSAKIFPEKTILIAMYGVTAGQIGFLEKPASTNQAICGLYPNESYNSDYFYQLLLTQSIVLLELGTGAAQPNISQQKIRDFEIYIPKSREEQTAIAQILTTSDKEIEKLEHKLEVLQQQKKYLLNNLITGKVRTPENL